MTCDALHIDTPVTLHNGRMILAFTGWMDGGEVSTGTVERLVDAFGARKVGRIDPEDFYIYNFPGSMEVSALFRPHTEIAGGRIQSLDFPSNDFYCNAEHALALFTGKEPNVGWRTFADCILAFARQANVSTLYFVGSFAGAVPHTREPRLIGSVSDESLKPILEQCGVKLADYEGPASFSTYLLTRAVKEGLVMVSLVAEIPPYIQGVNPKSIEAVVRKLGALLGLPIDVDDLRSQSDAWERRLNTALEEAPEVVKLIAKLEEDYDNEVFDTQMGDLKEWLAEKGVRVD